MSSPYDYTFWDEQAPLNDTGQWVHGKGRIERTRVKMAREAQREKASRGERKRDITHSETLNAAPTVLNTSAPPGDPETPRPAHSGKSSLLREGTSYAQAATPTDNDDSPIPSPPSSPPRRRRTTPPSWPNRPLPRYNIVVRDGTVHWDLVESPKESKDVSSPQCLPSMSPESVEAQLSPLASPAASTSPPPPSPSPCPSVSPLPTLLSTAAPTTHTPAPKPKHKTRPGIPAFDSPHAITIRTPGGVYAFPGEEQFRMRLGKGGMVAQSALKTKTRGQKKHEEKENHRKIELGKAPKTDAVNARTIRPTDATDGFSADSVNSKPAKVSTNKGRKNTSINVTKFSQDNAAKDAPMKTKKNTAKISKASKPSTVGTDGDTIHAKNASPSAVTKRANASKSRIPVYKDRQPE